MTSIYFPYFRGKQNELITVRETAPLLAASSFTPIIEPVKENLNGLKRSLESVVTAGGQAIVIVNPFHGDLSGDGVGLTALLAEHFEGCDGISAGVLLKGEMNVAEALECCEAHQNHNLALIHAGFSDAKGLTDALGDGIRSMGHIFFEPYCGKLYQRHFQRAQRVLVRDGFQRRKNREHPLFEFFSDLHITYPEEGMDGFGDFLIVGDDYSETGGPAYAVAIHITCIDHTQDNTMYVYHFLSDRMDTPKDPAGKFLEALNKLILELNKPNSKIFESEAMGEFREFHRRKHFPGLGYLKKLSMQHHIETLANFFA